MAYSTQKHLDECQKWTEKGVLNKKVDEKVWQSLERISRKSRFHQTCKTRPGEWARKDLNKTLWTLGFLPWRQEVEGRNYYDEQKKNNVQTMTKVQYKSRVREQGKCAKHNKMNHEQFIAWYEALAWRMFEVLENDKSPDWCRRRPRGSTENLSGSMIRKKKVERGRYWAESIVELFYY